MRRILWIATAIIFAMTACMGVSPARDIVGPPGGQPDSSRRQCNLGWSGSGCRTSAAAVSTKTLLELKSEWPEADGGSRPTFSDQVNVKTPQEKARDDKAALIIKELDADPLSDKAQGDARSVILSCKDSATIEDMHHCTGFLVTPVTRLNCLNQGVCEPLPWSERAVANGNPEWFGWQKYSDTADVQVAVVLQPWITTPEIAKQCADQSTTNVGTVDQSPFVLCLVRNMGGKNTARAIGCYQKNIKSPTRFAACLENVEVNQTDELQINCVIGMHQFDKSCEKALGLSHAEAEGCLAKGVPRDASFARCLRSIPKSSSLVNQCIIRAGGAAADLAACIEKLPVKLPLMAQCGTSAGGDATMLAQCIKGAKAVGANPAASALESCIAEAEVSASSDPSRIQASITKCAALQAGMKGVSETYSNGSSLVNCVNDKKLTFDQRADCLRDAGMHLPPTAQLSNCIKSARTGIDVATCVGLPGIDEIRESQRCIDKEGAGVSASLACVATILPSAQTKSAACLAEAHVPTDAIKCINGQWAGGLDEARHCFDMAKGDANTGARCLALVADKPQAEALACLVGSHDPYEVAECAGVKGASIAKAVQSCLSGATTDALSSVECFSKSAGLNGAKEALCMMRARTGLDIAACTQSNTVAQIIAVRGCFEAEGDDFGRQALCAAAHTGLPPKVAHLVECASTSKSYEEGAACMVAPSLTPQLALVVRCGAEVQGSPAGMAICMAGPSMNAELRIAAECLASSGGEPTSFAACSGGRLTLKEIQQCISGGFRSDKGCFGPNNTIVRYFDAQEKILRGVMRAAGLERSYDNFLSDLHRGRLGKNNDIVKAINLIGLGSPESAGRRLIQGFGLYGQLLIGGTNDLKGAVAAARSALAATVISQLGLVPTVSLGPDHIAVSIGNTGMSLGDGRVGGKFLGKSWSL